MALHPQVTVKLIGQLNVALSSCTEARVPTLLAQENIALKGLLNLLAAKIDAITLKDEIEALQRFNASILNGTGVSPDTPSSSRSV